MFQKKKNYYKNNSFKTDESISVPYISEINSKEISVEAP